METAFHMGLALAVLAVPLFCAYLIVRRLERKSRRPAPPGRRDRPAL